MKKQKDKFSKISLINGKIILSEEKIMILLQECLLK